jgi:hypothetical protein
MKKVLITVALITIFIGGLFTLYRNRYRFAEEKTPDTDQINQTTNEKQKLESKIDNQSAVTVTVTPIDLASESKKWKFAIVMDTHSVELTQDIAKSSVLIDDQGKEYTPIDWEGTSGGHHREGVLLFDQILPFPKSVEMKISGVGDVVRSFLWQLN